MIRTVTGPHMLRSSGMPCTLPEKGAPLRRGSIDAADLGVVQALRQARRVHFHLEGARAARQQQHLGELEHSTKCRYQATIRTTAPGVFSAW